MDLSSLSSITWSHRCGRGVIGQRQPPFDIFTCDRSNAVCSMDGLKTKVPTTAEQGGICSLCVRGRSLQEPRLLHSHRSNDWAPLTLTSLCPHLSLALGSVGGARTRLRPCSPIDRPDAMPSFPLTSSSLHGKEQAAMIGLHGRSSRSWNAASLTPYRRNPDMILKQYAVDHV
jgi:hypothetical protein